MPTQLLQAMFLLAGTAKKVTMFGFLREPMNMAKKLCAQQMPMASLHKIGLIA